MWGQMWTTSMSRTIERLKPIWVERVKEGIKAGKPQTPGMHCDGAGLYLEVTERGASWIFRYAPLNGRHGRTRQMGLGPLTLYGLAEVRALALDARRLRHQGIDPIEHRNAARAQQRLDDAKAITFRRCADAYVEAHRSAWRSSRHAEQWSATLKTYVYPVLGALPVQAIDTALVMKALQPLWTAKTETASRVRGRIESILDWAKVRGYRDGDNPARWRGHLDHLLPARSKVQRAKHHAALSYPELPGFMAELRQREGVAARALEFCILTAARLGEVTGARWNEFNLLDKVWTIPGHRMKAGKEHRIPLAPRALAILEDMQTHRSSDDSYVFPGSKHGRSLTNKAVWILIRRRMGVAVTTHGFRSTFSDWGYERSNYSNHVIELSLAHAIGSAVERAYRRTDLFEQRRRLMDAWATFCTTAPVEHDKVVALQRR
jgi:integrase